MKQQMEILVVTEVDHDKTPSNRVYEAAIEQAIKEALKDILGTPKKATLVGFEYGDPV